ncbi:nitrate ABC transporter permease [Synechococcus sp. PCC 7502]|uniref:nitrate ABC transporter permease n=1 Tax=Synechococcus sp. PCC 7502 TaxID=1173263 RepID=UPI001FF039C3|nr:nitrate ABC transporter permease [Synechococcus sp. PCC 7502]
MQGQLKFVVPPVLALGILLLIWQFLCEGEAPPLPPPTKVVSEAWNLIADPFFDNGGTDKGLGRHIFESLKRVGIGYSASVVFGISLGILIGTNVVMYRAFDPIFQVLRTVPPLAWLPISSAVFESMKGSDVLKFLGTDAVELSAIFVIFITSVWPVLMNTAVGVQQVPQDYRNVAKVLRLSRTEYFVTILIPSAAPYIFTGLRIAIGLSWLAIVAAEMLKGGVGIGFFIWDSYNSGKYSEMIVALFYVGIVGLLLDKVVFYISKFTVQTDS